MKIFIFLLSLFVSFFSHSQYIGVKARYVATRLVDDAPNPPRRENRLILSFFEVDAAGVYTPTSVSGYAIYLYNGGLQYGSDMGGVLDSAGNNYNGYAYTAPRVVSYHNSLGLNYVDCNPGVMTHLIANGHELDCGYVLVSYWDIDWGTMLPYEAFTAPNIALPYYSPGHPYYNYLQPNFHWPVPPGPPYNWYSTDCGGGLTSFVIRGVLPAGTSDGELTVLPVQLANVRGVPDANDQAIISWANLTESAVASYTVERSIDGILFQPTGTVLPLHNNGGRADYSFTTLQTAHRIYYRIKAIEINGMVYYSPVITVRTIIAPAAASFTVYPNPVTTGELTIRLGNAEAGRYVFSLLSSSHRRWKQKLIVHAGGDLVRSIDLAGLPPGLYTAVLQSHRQRFLQKVLYVH